MRWGANGVVLTLIEGSTFRFCCIFMGHVFVRWYLPSEVQADVVLKDQGISKLARAQRAGVQSAGVRWPRPVSGQMGPEAALC